MFIDKRLTLTTRPMLCCGVYEISGILGNTPESVVAACIRQNIIARPHIIFTSNDRFYGDDLKDYIIANKLGSVKASVRRTNPNSGNGVVVYVWSRSTAGIAKWRAKHGV